MWHEIRSNVIRYSGSSGTVTLTPGAIVLQIIAHGQTPGATVQIFNDAAALQISNPSAYFVYRPQHLNTTADVASNTIVFTNTQMYMVEVAVPTGA